jgi:hypothetical protein
VLGGLSVFALDGQLDVVALVLLRLVGVQPELRSGVLVCLVGVRLAATRRVVADEHVVLAQENI